MQNNDKGGSLDIEEIKDSNIDNQSQIIQKMNDLLVKQFDANIKAFQHFFPEVLSKFDNFSPSRSFEFFCSENGIPNLRFVDNGDVLYQVENPREFYKDEINLFLNSNKHIFCFHSQYDPYGQLTFKYLNEAISVVTQAKKQEEIIKLSDSDYIQNLIMFGCGLGYQLEELYDRIDVLNLVLIEPSKDIFYASLFAFDWNSFLNNLSSKNLTVKIIVESDANMVLEEMQKFYYERGVFVSSEASFFRTYGAVDNFDMDILTKGYPQTIVGTLGFFDDFLFGISHCCDSILKGKGFVVDTKLKDEFTQLPVFVIGSGPSLDNDIPFIRKFQDKAIVIACGTAIDALYHAGIKPDFYSCTERGPEVAQALEIIPDKHFFDDIILITGSATHPLVTQYFKHTAIFGKKDERFVSYLKANLKDFSNVQEIELMNPLVGNVGLSSALHLGFKKFYLFGIDCGKRLSAEKIHSKYASLYNNYGPNDQGPQFSSAIRAEANFGGDCGTNELFLTSAQMIHSVLYKFKDNHVECYNCSDGLFIKGTKPCRSDTLSESFMNLRQIDKKSFFEYMIKERTVSFELDSKTLHGVIHKELFNHICQNIIGMLKEATSSRRDVVLKMQEISEFLDKISKKVSRFYSHCVTSSLQRMFIEVSLALNISKDESKCMETADRVLKLTERLLGEMQDVFGFLPDYVCAEHKKHFKDGKLGKPFSDHEAPNIPANAVITKKDYDDPLKVFEKKQ